MQNTQVQAAVIWAPVVAALGASLLTGLVGWGLIGWQRRQSGRDAARTERFAAYQELVKASLAFALRARAMGDLMRLRSGIGEGLQVLAGHRKPLDLLDVYNWFEPDMTRLNDAWSHIWTTGSQEAIDAADRVVDVTGDLMEAAGSLPPRNPATKLYRAVVGETWSKEQLDTYNTTLVRFAEERVRFVQLVRQEAGREEIEMTLERMRREAAEE